MTTLQQLRDGEITAAHCIDRIMVFLQLHLDLLVRFSGILRFHLRLGLATVPLSQTLSKTQLCALMLATVR
jgi:hypothetical protein